MVKKAPKIKRSSIILVAVFVSVLLYVAGVLTGLNANKILQQQVAVEISDVKNLLYTSTLDLKSLQLQQFYIDNFPDKDQCSLLDIYINNLYNRISDYWQILPNRIEEYDQQGQKTDEYTSLKREYIRLSLRFWLTATKYNDACAKEEPISILYFYTPSCEDCITQGKEFDAFQESMPEKKIIIFPIDATFPDDTVYMLITFYNITSYPTTIVNNNVIEGKVISADDLRAYYE